MAIRALRLLTAARLAGIVPTRHVALTFDDGPAASSTPAVLAEFDRLGVRATFFVLGSELAARPELGRDAAAAGHELAVHGWTHRPHLVRGPRDVATDLARAHALVHDVAGRPPQFWRPPHGILTGTGAVAGAALRMRPVLWTADGRDWRADATPATVAGRVRRLLRPGGVVLLHDSDVTSATGSWQNALGALPEITAWCADQGWPVGPLGEHVLP
jgi:peptidoglycan/xylan/chitin deacetylase (PgdA/CDA1 family)